MEKGENYWEDYARELREVIIDPKSGMLLKANNFSHTGNTDNNCYFKLTSKKYCKEFISIWELFDEHNTFEKFVKMFSELALYIRDNKGINFNKIVTSSHTSKELVKYIKPMLEEENITTVYYGDYPTITIDDSTLFKSPEKNVLIITDIIASGTLVEKLANIVDIVGDKIVGVLAVAITDQTIINNKRISISNHSNRGVNQENINEKIPVFSLTTYEIEYWNKKPKNSHIIKIDPITVYPYQDTNLHVKKETELPISKFFRYLCEASALTYGFYKLGGRRYTTIFKFDRLLNNDNFLTDYIWDSIQKKILNSDIIISSYRKEDLDFKNFVYKKLLDSNVKREKNYLLLTIKRDVKDTPLFYFTINNKQDFIKDKKIVVLLSTSSTTEKLKSITSLLFSIGAKQVHIVCLISRIGPYTTSFVRWVQEINAMIPTEISSVSFSFQYIFEYKEYRYEEIETMHERINNIFKNFINNSQTEAFRNTAKSYSNLFKPETFINSNVDIDKLVTNMKLEDINDDSGSKIYKDYFGINVSDISEHDEVCATNYYTAFTRNYDLIERLIRQASTAFAIRHIIGIIIIDIDYLQFNSGIESFISLINKRIESIRSYRRDLANELIKGNKVYSIELHDELFKVQQIEINLILGLSLISSISESVLSTLDTDISDIFVPLFLTEDFLNFKYIYESDFFFCLPLLVNNIYAGSKHIDMKNNFKLTINDRLKKISSSIDDIKLKHAFYARVIKKENPSFGYLMPNIGIINNNVNWLNSEFNTKDILNKFQMINRLLDKIVVRPNHQEIYQTFITSINEYKFNEGDYYYSNKYSFSKCITMVYSLIDLSRLIRNFLRLDIDKYINVQEFEYFLNEDKGESLLRDAYKIEKILLAIVDESDIRKEVISQFEFYTNKIFIDYFFNRNSSIRKSLEKFITQVSSVIEYLLSRTIRQIKDFYVKHQYVNYKNLLLEQLNYAKEYVSQIDPNLYIVLFDNEELQAILHNLLSNSRHTFELVKRNKPRETTTLFKINIEKENEFINTEKLELVKISIITYGILTEESLFNSSNTLSKNKTKIEEFGGFLEVKANSEEKNSTITLKLRSQETYNWLFQ